MYQDHGFLGEFKLQILCSYHCLSWSEIIRDYAVAVMSHRASSFDPSEIKRPSSLQSVPVFVRHSKAFLVLLRWKRLAVSMRYFLWNIRLEMRRETERVLVDVW